MSLCAFVCVCFVVTCWERADLLALVCGVWLWVCHFPIGIPGQVWYLIVSIPDLCTLTYSDMLPARIMKELAVEISPLLAIIFPKSLDIRTVTKTGRLPKWLQSSRMEKSTKSTTTGPSPLHAFAARSRNIITSNVSKHLDKHRILTNCQHGFQARRSCETQLLTIAEELISGLDKKQHDLIILDFSKAFYRVPHQHLPKKLAFNVLFTAG